MVRLGDFLKLIVNFYNDAAVIEVFDSDKISAESDGLSDDIAGFAFSFSVGEKYDFLNPHYMNAEIKELYIYKKRVIKVLVKVPDTVYTDGVDIHTQNNE